MAEETNPIFQDSVLREFMEHHRTLTVEKCLIEYNKMLKHKIDETYENNVLSIKKYFDEEVKSKA